MKRDKNIKGLIFHLGNYTPRKNEFERGLKYRLFVDNIPTGYTFGTLREGWQFVNDNYWRWL